MKNRVNHLGAYCLVENNEKVLVIKKARGPYTGRWDLPGGKIEFGEDPISAAHRELKEETGLTAVELTLTDTLSNIIDELHDEIHHIGIIYNAQVENFTESLKSEPDEQDSLGAEWIQATDLNSENSTPFLLKASQK